MKDVPPLEKRLQAYQKFQELRLRSSWNRRRIVRAVSAKYGITETTLYEWFKGQSPLGRRAGRIRNVKELLYVIGAILGDGWIYHWRGNFQVGVVGERDFVAKYAGKLGVCLRRNVPYYKYGKKNAWFVRVGNAELYFLISRIREDLSNLRRHFAGTGQTEREREFIEGFFDAEGCVKIIREQVRTTPKVCLDICNTNLGYLLVVKRCIKRTLALDSRISVQVPSTTGRKPAYHLRIYDKKSVRVFLRMIDTTKLSDEKRRLASAWLEKGEKGEVST